jgi:hypothetical protein
MSKLVSLMIVFALILATANTLPAKFDITANATLGWPVGGQNNYSFGSTGVGGTLRLSTNMNRFSKVFIQGRMLDFGLSRGYIPRDNDYSDSNVESVTDSYIVSVTPGISLGLNYGGVIPYVSFMAGVAHHETYSRINSRDLEGVVEFSETSGNNFQYGGGFGIRTTMWESKNRNSWLDSIAFDFRFEYLESGEMDYLDRRTIRFKNGGLLFDNTVFESKMSTVNVGLSAKF